MKVLQVAALLGVLVAGSAFAQSNASAGVTQTANNDAATSVAAPASNWVPPYGQAVAPKTRAQVYQELIQAQKDGQLNYLNSTIYAHS
jgi:hypothetical protein